MRSTFMGLETAKRGMYAQQSAIYVTGHNIANANTPGYTRQRVNFKPSEPFPGASMNRPQIPGQVGTGVEDDSIQRIREKFIDVQFRNENTKFGYYQTLSSNISKMEDIFNEPSDHGLSKAMVQFWQSLQDLSTNGDNEGARRVVIERGKAVSETFQYLHESLTTFRSDVGNEIEVTVKNVNSLLKQISNVNEQISAVEPHGYLPNDLYDERDRLIDELSGFLPIKTSYDSNGGNSLDIAEGNATVKLVIGEQEIVLVDKSGAKTAQLDGTVLNFGGNDSIDLASDELKGKGSLSALIYTYGDMDNETGLYPSMLADLDKYAFTFAKLMNEVHQKGFDLNGEEGQPMFDIGDDYKGAADRISVLLTHPSEVAASINAEHSGNGENALILSKVKDIVIKEGVADFRPELDLVVEDLPVQSGSIQSFYEGVIGKMAVEGQQANRLEYTSQVLLNSVDYQRSSISGVSLDEEFSNLIQYQHAYAASARMVTVVDEMLDKIINGMGLGGR